MWKASPEFSILHYLIAYQATDNQWKTTESKDSSVKISGLKAGSMVQLKAINSAGLEGLDWAKVSIKLIIKA